MQVKEKFDELFSEVEFDRTLYERIMYSNIDLKCSKENKSLFGGQLIGCYLVKYTYIDEDKFFNELFELDRETVGETISHIRSIPSNFVISRDPVNLTCFYVAHRFLSNKKLKEEERVKYAEEILHHFNYRTLIVLHFNWFKYPITEEKAVSLFERLSGKYLIKHVRNWDEYCRYRSEEYIKSKFRALLETFNDDHALPNAINDLHNRTKDMLKNVYREFVNMQGSQEILKKNRSVVDDIEGQQVMMEKLNTPDIYHQRLVASFSDRQSFIRLNHVAVVSDVIKNISYERLMEALGIVYDFIHLDHKTYKETVDLTNRIIVNVLDYVQKNQFLIGSGATLIKITNMLIGNVLYARGEDVEINRIKDELMVYLDKAYRKLSEEKKPMPTKAAPNIRNSIFIYFFLRAFIEG